MTGCREENNYNNQSNFVIIYIHAYFIENAYSFLRKPHLFPSEHNSSLTWEKV